VVGVVGSFMAHSLDQRRPVHPPQVAAAPATIAHNQSFIVQVQLAAGTILKHLRVFRLISATHQFGAAEGDLTSPR
jgi:hypothetical protein